MQQARVLVVEDEQDVRQLMLLHLKREGHEGVGVESAEEAWKLIAESESTGAGFQLVVLDWMLPQMPGVEFCRRLRSSSGKSSQVPVLMVTARAETADIVLGLEVGADDYLVKPFEIPVFLARIRALLRRALLKDEKDLSRIQVGGLLINLESYEVKCHGEPANLTPSEFKLLSALMTHRGKVLSREKLIELVQGEGVTVVDRAIDTHVFGLRKKLGTCADVIETIRGVGYRVVE